MSFPPMPAEVRVPPEIRFGPGALAAVGEIAARHGARALLVTGAGSLNRSGAFDRAVGLLRSAGVEAAVQAVAAGEPDVATVDEAAARARAARCDVVVAVGGGSALDLGKAAAGVAANEGSQLDYLEGIGTGRTMARGPLPFIAVPTTAGTGSEATRNAVIAGRTREGEPVKRSFRDPRLLPAAAIVDPELMTGCPPDVTATCGMDALTQLVESLTSLKATAATDALALSGIETVGRCLARAVERGEDLEARTGMAYAALLSGVTLSHAGLGAVHGLAGPVGGRAPIPHGLICAVLLPLVTEANLAALRAGPAGRPDALAAYARADRALGAPLLEFCRRFSFRGLSSFGFGEADIAPAVAAATSGSMKTNPVVLPAGTLAAVLRRAL